MATGGQGQALAVRARTNSRRQQCHNCGPDDCAEAQERRLMGSCACCPDQASESTCRLDPCSALAIVLHDRMFIVHFRGHV